MPLVREPREGGTTWPARFVSRTSIALRGFQVEATGRALAAAFNGDGWRAVRSLRLDGAPDDGCWFGDDDWWLSARAA